MCFSATASFAGSAILTSIGITTIRRNQEPSQRLFATIPLVFGLQQASEGVVWLTLPSPGQEELLRHSTIIFLIAAVVIWPTMVPLSVMLMEEDRRRRRILYGLLGIGVALSAGYAYGLLNYKVSVSASQYHILYSLDSPPALVGPAAFAYVVATILPLFVSGKKRVHVFGIVVLLAYAVTQYFFSAYLVSVWCFFAAIASAVIWWIVRSPAENPAMRHT